MPPEHHEDGWYRHAAEAVERKARQCRDEARVLAKAALILSCEVERIRDPAARAEVAQRASEHLRDGRWWADKAAEIRDIAALLREAADEAEPLTRAG